MLHEICVSGTVGSPLLTTNPPLACIKAKNRGSGNCVSNFRVSRGPPVMSTLTFWDYL